VAPSFPVAWSNLGNDLADLKEHEAIAALKKVLELNLCYSDAHFNLADTLAQLGREMEALPHWPD
jgi:hypothetical protein